MFKASVKTLAIAAAIAATSTAAFASGSDHIFLGEGQDVNTRVELDLVRASSAGTVDIYSFHKGVKGELLGSASLRAGAHTDVNINLKTAATTDLIAVLNIAGSVADSVEIDQIN
jgi:hypothetical protein